MRLNKEHIDFIKRTATALFGENTKVYLFGSRVDDNKKGGDIDIYIETTLKTSIFEKKIEMLKRLHEYMGEQKIDIVINNHTSQKFIYEVAKQEGVIL
ncbi:MAG: nucleotidyltransferase domain-containing protein [Melioribacteraceae bacterium]|nr:nucleotidyltransferase domain-containing protein [Melioribacteraceae bacterium]MCF8356093.1 nucleotidyltransferase domain-containing protein [Melioribacteraceae bacterium]MCF8395548.1 nucleotidyltransferase domain-containing protein [Melioribacteraceae bacterium]MCF8420620.1 nucleotidyltransferase domain-containing protein [Melioribacteraceae bacterium]